MITILPILISLSLTGLGFLTYKHPPLARMILWPLLYITMATFCLLQFKILFENSVYYELKDATNILIADPPHKDLNIDSAYKALANKDSINILMLEDKLTRQKILEIGTARRELAAGIGKRMNEIHSRIDDQNVQYQIYLIGSLATIVIFLVLSYLFDTLYKKPSADN